MLERQIGHSERLTFLQNQLNWDLIRAVENTGIHKTENVSCSFKCLNALIQVRNGYLYSVELNRFPVERSRFNTVTEVMQLFKEAIGWVSVRLKNERVERQVKKGLIKPEWRNWQTRTTQNRVGAIPCGFDSHLGHSFDTSRKDLVEKLQVREFRNKIHWILKHYNISESALLSRLSRECEEKKYPFLTEALDALMDSANYFWNGWSYIRAQHNFS